MAVEVESRDGALIRGLVPLNRLSTGQFAELCTQMDIEEIQRGILFEKGDTDSRLIYLLSGQVSLQADGLLVEVISAENEGAKFALAHQLPRKIDAVIHNPIRILRLDADYVNLLLTLNIQESESLMSIEERSDQSSGKKNDWMTTLLRSPIFQRLPPANLQKVLTSLSEVRFSQGVDIIQQGAEGDYYYLIKSGQCLISRKPSPNVKAVKLARLGPGDTFGEDSLLSDLPRNMTVTALTEVTLLQLHKAQFIPLIKTPSLVFVSYGEVQTLIKQGAVLMDVRSPDEFQLHHLPHSFSVPFFSLRMQVKSLNRDNPVVVVCADGKVSEAAAFLLLRHKFKAYILAGGMTGLPKMDLAVDPLQASVPPAALPVKQQDNESPSLGNAGLAQIELPGDELAGLVEKLQAENAALVKANQALNSEYQKLLLEKEYFEEQNKTLLAQFEKFSEKY
ncbi:MAG: Crp/Fnr family transcriptional regulator [Methylobacter sp.]|nr:MAG: Crp/Fnr family transcriptional regulator [Methylobacter sp.]PPD22155.1 MAG: Crp/Fnr family transcriptional regulator [Methylobacter sp.]PPD35335.1 MAG: Crp/Fnr family transcriptional regulator [Methylomonas sp.]